MVHIGNVPCNSRSPEFSNDLDFPIVLRKEKRSCIQHPISKFVSYEGLSLGYKAHATPLIEHRFPWMYWKPYSTGVEEACFGGSTRP